MYIYQRVLHSSYLYHVYLYYLDINLSLLIGHSIIGYQQFERIQNVAVWYV